MQQLQILTTAVNDKRLVSFDYDGLRRVVEPHAVGFGKGESVLMRGFQVEGESATQTTGWKLFKADKIEGLTLTPEVFNQPREGYKPGDKAMSQILAEVPA